ncbi:hypothetical protein [Kutzneria sp. NPDC052558]|uniref:hypothetical protein n=1 Tax=Kutzneria sp. NPDC052558 TaxID=3364121 RepID=UPI0037C5A135
MNENITDTENRKPRTGRRWLASAACVAAMAGTGVLLAASPASADAITTHCSVYHSWTECLAYDYTTGNFGLSAYNGYSVSEYETLWFTVNGYEYSESFTIPSHDTRGFNVHTAPGYACEGIDSVLFYCWQY